MLCCFYLFIASKVKKETSAQNQNFSLCTLTDLTWPNTPSLPIHTHALLHLGCRLAQHDDGGQLTGGSERAGKRDWVDIGGRSGILNLAGIRVWSWRDINVKWRGQVCFCPITLHPVTANQGANNRRKGLIALDSAPTTGPIMATYWLPVLVQPLLCREIVWNFQHGLRRSEWGKMVGIKSWIMGREHWGKVEGKEWCKLLTGHQSQTTVNQP